MSEPCPADASVDEKPLPDGAEKRESEVRPSLGAVLVRLSKAMRNQTELMAMLVNQQQQLIDLIDQQDDGEQDDDPMVDMEGNPIRERQ